MGKKRAKAGAATIGAQLASLRVVDSSRFAGIERAKVEEANARRAREAFEETERAGVRARRSEAARARIEQERAERIRRANDPAPAKFTKIDASFLPTGWEQRGRFAEFYEDGQLKAFGRYQLRNNKKLEDALRLDRGVPSGTSGSREHWDSYRANGTVESFDAWSDASIPSPVDWVAWVRLEIKRIAR
jgi:hypothetical protein